MIVSDFKGILGDELSVSFAGECWNIKHYTKIRCLIVHVRQECFTFIV